MMGKNNIEHALKKLDRLTQEEAQMASVQILQITHAIDSEVREIADNVNVVDNRVAGVDERVAGVDERVAGVDEHVAGVDERVAGVNERVAGVDDRVSGVDERVAGVADGVDQIQRSWFPNRIHAGHAGSTVLTGDRLQQNLRTWLSP